jgi:hypothetical protein
MKTQEGVQSHAANMAGAEMEYYAKFINHRAEIVTRREAIHALLDFANERTTVFGAGGHVVARDYIDLASTFEILLTLREQIARQAKEEPKGKNGAITFRVGPGHLLLTARGETGQVIEKLVNRFRRVMKVIKEAEAIGLRIEREPYSEHLREIETTGFRRVTLHSVACFKAGKLEALHPLKISGQFNPKQNVEIKVPPSIKTPEKGHKSENRYGVAR